MRRYDTVPKKDGFRMPAAYEHHAGCWMLWPQRPDTWRLGAKPAQRVFVDIARAIRRFEPLTVGVNQDQYENAVEMLPDDIRVVELASNGARMRDTGPTFVVNDDTSEVRGIDWKFNAWGGHVDGLYSSWELDQQIARKVCDMEYKSRYRLGDFVLEGGAVHCDGEGTILTTEECLLSPGRNPHLSKEEISEILCSYLGGKKVIWLKSGLHLDETNGHVDNICCFTAPGKVLLVWTDNVNDPQYSISAENLAILESETDALERKLEVLKIPAPSPVLVTKEEAEGVDAVPGTWARGEGARLPASYVNFYIANGGVLVPQFDDPMDGEALRIIQTCFPDREVVPIYTREMLLGGGSLHSMTLQQPSARRIERPTVQEANKEELPVRQAQEKTRPAASLTDTRVGESVR